jgi:hypothetical protein
MITQMGYAFIHPGFVPVQVAGHNVIVNGKVLMTEPMKSAMVSAGGPLHIAISIAILLGVFALGWWVFNKEAPRISENL